MGFQKIGRSIFFVAFFLCLILLSRFWVEAAGFTKVCNFGGPFGIMLSKWLLLTAFLGVSVFLVVQWQKEETFAFEWPWLLIFSGGLANLLERFFYGCITDYIFLPFFPMFNLADVLLTLGVLGVVLQWYIDREK